MCLCDSTRQLYTLLEVQILEPLLILARRVTVVVLCVCLSVCVCVCVCVSVRNLNLGTGASRGLNEGTSE